MARSKGMAQPKQRMPRSGNAYHDKQAIFTGGVANFFLVAPDGAEAGCPAGPVCISVMMYGADGAASEGQSGPIHALPIEASG